MGKGSIAIDRFTITALAAGGHVAPDRIRAKLDTVNAGALGAALARRVQGLGDADERLILIRRLDIGFAEGVASSGATLADELATRLAASLSRLDAVPAEHVVIFPDRTAFLAAFVRAVARGEVWDRWWFQRFEGLRFLPASTAIRTALEQDAGGGLAALLSLEEADRAAIVAALNPSDARRLLDSFSAIDGPPFEIAAAVAALADAALPWARLSADHLALSLVLAGASSGSGLSIASLSRAAAMIRELHRLDAQDREAVASALPEGRLSALTDSLAHGTLARLAPIFAAPAAARRRLAARLARAGRSHADAGPERAFTRWGGLLLLSDHLPPGCAGLPALLALAACAGPANMPEAIGDPTLRDALGLPPRPAPDEVRAWALGLEEDDLRRLTAAGRRPSLADARWLATPAALRGRPQARGAVQGLANAALHALTVLLPGFAQSSPGFLWRNLLDIGAWIAPEPGGLRAVLQRPPLDVLLAISGLADRVVTLADGRLLRLERGP